MYEWALDSDAKCWNESVYDANEPCNNASKPSDYSGKSRYYAVADHDESFKCHTATSVGRLS